MSDEQIIRILKVIRGLALLPYPFPDDGANDPSLALALGEIAGRATRAISDHERV